MWWFQCKYNLIGVPSTFLRNSFARSKSSKLYRWYVLQSSEDDQLISPRLDYVKIVKDFDYELPLELSTYSNYSYTNYMVAFHAVIDHIFFETKKFKFQRCIPMPTDAEVTEFTALPSCKIPSDHLALVMDLEMIK